MTDSGRVSSCVMYLGDGDDDWCSAPAWWRPANIPFRSDEWFCVQHATQIARQQGMWGIYHCNSPDAVEELPDETTPARGPSYVCDGIERTPNPCTCDCDGCKHHCAAHQPAAPARNDYEAKP